MTPLEGTEACGVTSRRLMAMEIWLSLCFISTALALDEVLMDTQLETEELNWLALPSSGWEEAVAVDKKFKTMRTYRVCNVEIPNQDNWLRSGFIRRREAQLVYVDLRFSMRDCRSFQRAGGSCMETFALYHRESDSEEPIPASSTSQLRGAYAKDTDVGAEHVFTLGGGGQVNRVTLRLGPLSKAGFWLAFRDRGACVNLLSVRTYFKKCPPTVVNLARFPEVPTGQELSSLVVGLGSCVSNAEAVSIPLKMHCTSEGDWIVPVGSCRCLPGYQSNEELTACREIEDHVTLPQVQSEGGPSQNASGHSCTQLDNQNDLLRANGRLLEDQAKILGHLAQAVQTLNVTLNAMLQRLPGLLKEMPHLLAKDGFSPGADLRDKGGQGHRAEVEPLN